MALIVEDGTIVAGANTYLTEAEANTILEGFGYVLIPATAEANLRTAAQYLESFRKRYQGTKVDCDQALQFPRKNVFIDCCQLASTVIPGVLKNAQALAAYEESIGNSLLNTSTQETVIEKSVAGVVTKKFADNGQDSSQKQFPKIDSQLEPLFNQFSDFQVFRV